MIARYAVLRASDIYNASAAPEHFYPLIKIHKAHWWMDEFVELRALISTWYRELYDINTGGHYAKLRDSIRVHGIQNPIIVTAGEPRRREAWQMPPYTEKYICEQNGGSRLYIAQELDLRVPCIINGDAPGDPMETLDDVRAKFTDKTYRIWHDKRVGIMTTPTYLSHLGAYSMRENQSAVHLTKEQVMRRVNEWLGQQGLPRYE